MIDIHDRFGESGKPEELLDFFGLTHPFIIKAVKKAILRRNSGHSGSEKPSGSMRQVKRKR